jgi:hypothetical protein
MFSRKNLISVRDAHAVSAHDRSGGTLHDTRRISAQALDARELARLLRASGARVIGEMWTDTAGAAIALGTSERTLRAWRLAGCGPRSYRPGGRLVMYLLNELAQHIRDSVVHDDLE